MNFTSPQRRNHQKDMTSRKQNSDELATEAEDTGAIGGIIDQMAQGLLSVQDMVRVDTALRKVVRQIQQERDQAIWGLREELMSRMQRLEVRMERVEEKVFHSVTVTGNRESAKHVCLEQLEGRIENVEAHSTMFPRVEALVAQQEQTSPPGALRLAPSTFKASTTTSSTSDLIRFTSFASVFTPTTSSHSTYYSISKTTLPSTTNHRPPFASAPGATGPGATAEGAVEEPFACHKCTAAYDEECTRQRLQLRLREMRTKWKGAKAAPSLQGEQLCMACRTGNLQEVRSILKTGPDVNYLAKSGEFPLKYALDKSDPDEALVSTLLESGADPHAVDRNGLTALHCAAVNDRSGRIVVKLLEAGSNVDPRIDCGATPLHFAAINNNELAVRTLLAAGAEKSLVPWDGSHKNKTPFDLATSDAVRDLLR